MTDRQYRNRVAKLEALQEQVDALNAQIKAVTEEIQTALGDTEEKDLGDRHIFWKWRAGGTRFDSKAFAKDHPDLKEQYTVEKPRTRFWKITEVKA